MKINIHAGHNPSGKVASGAVGFLNESNEARKVKDIVVKKLKESGNTVYDCTVNNGKSQLDVLRKIVDKCNAHKVDLDVSIHFNSGRKDYKGDRKTGGVEVWAYPGTRGMKYAKGICEAVEALGFTNRGVKFSSELYVLRKTDATAIIVECCFVDDKDDFKLYNAQDMADAIVEGIIGKKVSSVKETFLVKLKDNMNIRETPSVTGKIVKVNGAKKGFIYTIVDTRGNWGLLKSYADKQNGWINISRTYATRL